MPAVEPVPGAPAATATVPGGVALVVADYHAGIERALRREGVELESGAPERRERLRSLVAETDSDRVVFLGDLVTSIGDPAGEERAEVADLLDALSVPATLVPGNHDGGVAAELAIETTEPAGVRWGDVALCHGHTWPARDLLAAEALCVGHEHPAVRLEDSVGGSRVERAWLRGPLSAAPFAAQWNETVETDAELVVFPAFNDRSGGTWVNVEGQEFLSPFLPEALPEAQAYLLDGTRLGPFRGV